MKKKIIIVCLILTVASIIIGLYGTFASSSTVIESDNTYAITLTGNTSEVVVPASGSKTIIYQITNTNKGVVQYKIAYSATNINVSVYEDSIDDVEGFIDYGENKFIKLYIENKDTSDKTVLFKTILGYEHGGSLDALLSSGYNYIKDIHKKEHNVTYLSENLVYGLENIDTTSYYMKYTVNDGIITVTALQDDGYGYINARVYLEAGKTYVFDCDTSASNWQVAASGTDTVAAYLMLDGNASNYYIEMYSNKNYQFTPTTSGEYWLRLDVDKNGVTHTFSNISITSIIDTKTISYNSKYGDMPNIIKEGYTLIGWYTKPNGTGEKITSDTVMNTKVNHMLYAEYKANTYNVTYLSENLVYGLENVGVTNYWDYMQYTVNDGIVTVTALQDDGYGFINARVYLEAGKTYVFDCDTSASAWQVAATGTDTVAAYLVLNGSYNYYIEMHSNKNYQFTPTTSGEYWLRLDVDKNGKTHTFSNISITSIVDAKAIEYNSKYGDMPNITKEGYTLTGWYPNPNGNGEEITSDTVMNTPRDHMLYAEYMKNN